MSLFFAVAGLLAATLSGLPSPAPSGQPNTTSAESQSLDPGEVLQVRLVNGSSRCNGMVEVRLGLSWKPACGALWNIYASRAVCRWLGCGESEAEPIPPTPELTPSPATGNTSWAPNVTRALAPTIRCSSPEWQLCEVVEHHCSNEGLVQVTCAESRDLKLVGGGSPCEGRVEMLEHGQWGSVCDDTWDLEDAHVVCQQLSCGWAVQALPGLHFPPGQGRIHRDQVNCSGSENYLWDCPGLPGNGYCGHKEDAGVVCSEHQSWRLTGGTDPCEGQVEVYYRGVWNTVCDSSWYEPEAKVLCQDLGCGTVARRPKGPPHSLSGKMYYSCEGGEAALSECFWRFNNSNLCRESRAARVLCSGAWSLLNLSTSEAPARDRLVTVEPSVMVKIKDWTSREIMLLISCIILGILLLVSFIFIALILLRIKGKYVPKLPIPVQALPPEDSGSDSDYEHYDFSTQPPVALTTFYNSQRHRFTDEEVQKNRFQMPPLEEGLEEMQDSQVPPDNPGQCKAQPPSLGSQQPPSKRGSSTSSGEEYCNSPSSRLPPWNSHVFSSEQDPLLEPSPNLELAGSQTTFPGFPRPPSDSSSDEDYDDIGAA
uniref:T-cell differentiation antigen CD6 n=1 Tax=Sus scrofa TaxID=9823 RepID=A0A8D1WPD6_PIG